MCSSYASALMLTCSNTGVSVNCEVVCVWVLHLCSGWKHKFPATSTQTSEKWTDINTQSPNVCVLLHLETIVSHCVAAGLHRLEMKEASVTTSIKEIVVQMSDTPVKQVFCRRSACVVLRHQLQGPPSGTSFWCFPEVPLFRSISIFHVLTGKCAEARNITQIDQKVCACRWKSDDFKKKCRCCFFHKLYYNVWGQKQFNKQIKLNCIVFNLSSLFFCLFFVF